MQSGIHKEVDFIELEGPAEVELRVQDDSTVGLCINSESPELDATSGSCAASESSASESGETLSSRAASGSSAASETSATLGSSAVSSSSGPAQSGQNPVEPDSTNPIAPVQNAAAKSVQSYAEFSERFGNYTKPPGRAFKVWNQWRQHFNFIYFSVSAVAIATVSIVFQLPLLWLVTGLFVLFGLAAFRAGWNSRMHPKDFAVTLSARTKMALRVTALVFPIPFIMWVMVAQPMSYQQLHRGQQLFRDENYQEALSRFNRAAMLNPGLEKAFRELANCYNFTHEYDKSLTDSEKALQLDPTDGAAWASKAWALNKKSMYAEALPAALKAVDFAPESGQANHALADAYYALGDYEKALAPASKHVEIHYAETSALYLRANILDKLGRGEEAAKDRAAAADLSRQDDE